MQRIQTQPAKPIFWPFVVWLGIFYSAWLSLVVGGGYWPVVRQHCGIAVAMAAGSYFAGSTPMGGGTVGFPVLVLLFHGPATLGRDFSFAIQSIGMVSASIYILCRRRPLEKDILKWAMVGAAVGTPLGILWVAPLVSELVIKLTFAITWASFGFLHLWKLRELASHEGITPGAQRFDRVSGLLIGFLGSATVASITGVGMEMILYAVLVLMCQADLRIAIPTAVMLMAFTSVVGLVTKLTWTGLQSEVFGHWLAAAPVVVVGAPLGALVVNYIGRKPTLVLVSVLCIIQLAWMIAKEWQRLGPWGLLATFAAVGAMLAAFAGLHRLGKKLARRGAN